MNKNRIFTIIKLILTLVSAILLILYLKYSLLQEGLKLKDDLLQIIYAFLILIFSFNIISLFFKKIYSSLLNKNNTILVLLINFFLSLSTLTIIMLSSALFYCKIFHQIDYRIFMDNYFEISIKVLVLLLFTMFFFTIIHYLLFVYQHYYVTQIEIERFKSKHALLCYETLNIQLSPHFLFNNLNTISALLYSKTTNINTYIKQFAEIYQYVIQNTNNHLVPLKNELAFLQCYINLLNIRYGNSLQIKIEIPDNCMQKFIPPVTLQILLENVIKHNEHTQANPLHIDIESNKNNYLTFRNNIVKKENKIKSTHTGISNLHKRYALLTNKKVIVDQNDVNFSVSIPLLDKKALKSEYTKIINIETDKKQIFFT